MRAFVLGVASGKRRAVRSIGGQRILRFGFDTAGSTSFAGPALAARRWVAADSLIDFSKVYAKKDAYGGVGAYAARAIKKGEVVERGIVRRLPVDGNKCAYVFTWSPDRSEWASGSGCSVFYNAALVGQANTEMHRHFDEDRFEIVALRDIAEDEEVTHLYKSLEWRECFKELKDLRDSGKLTASPIERTPLNKRGDLIDSSKVYAKRDAYGGVGAYAALSIKKGELVERGIVRRLPVDGNECPFVFTWSDDRSVWASGSGFSVFYNASLEGNNNSEMVRITDEDRFEIYATQDIPKDEELTHLYKSLEWRDCFKDLKEIRDNSLKEPNLDGTKDISSDKSRDSFREYWGNDHSAPTLENMMLDSDAGDMDRLERPEILSALPSLSGKRVIELGAGIGRFSGVLAAKAGEVVAVDFVESSCAENRRANAAYKNLRVIQADVTSLEQPEKSFDLVFSNWLLMYLSDDEVKQFAKNCLKWLRPGGHLFFRESCFHASGNHARRFNPTQYRDPETYAQIFSEATSSDGSRFQLLATNCVESYAKIKGNMHQMWFRWEKLGPEASERRKRIMATNQYSVAHCHRYEKIYGRNYIYTGGNEVSDEILKHCELQQGGRVLDIGSGLLGTGLRFAEQRPDIFVHGVTFISELASFVAGRHVGLPNSIRDRIACEVVPELGVPEHELKYPPNAFDAVVMRETMMYLSEEDKPIMLQKLLRLLRPGGKLVVVDYTLAKPAKDLNPHFREYLNEWAYYLMETAEQQKMIGRYMQVERIDAADRFVKYMDQGLGKIEEEFGTRAPARNVLNAKGVEDQLEAIRGPLTQQVRTLIPRLAEDAVEEAAEAAVQKVALHLAAAQTQAAHCEADYDWAKNIWNMERHAAAAGELGWSFFVGTKQS